MYALELHRRFGSVAFEYLRGDADHRLTFSLAAPPGWKDTAKSEAEQQGLDEFHLNVCSEALRAFGTESFPLACEGFSKACAGLKPQRFPTCELCAAFTANSADELTANWPADSECNGTVADTEAFGPLYGAQDARPRRNGDGALSMEVIQAWVKAGRPVWHTLDPHRTNAIRTMPSTNAAQDLTAAAQPTEPGDRPDAPPEPANATATALQQKKPVAQLHYNVGAGVAGQYVFNPCDALWTAGDVCPEMMHCAVEDQLGSRETVSPDEEDACKITGLPGWGYNPSVVAAPKWLRERAGAQLTQLGLASDIAFVATSRMEASNKAVACMNPKVVDWDERSTSNATASDVMLLDGKWNILYRMPIRGGSCQDNPEAVQDARLLLAGGSGPGDEDLFVTFMSYKGTWRSNMKKGLTKSFGSPDCAGHWLARLHVTLGQDSHGGTLNALVANGARRLHAERNAGIVVSRQTREAVAELTNLVPAMSWRTIPNGTEREDLAPESFAESVHNSIHPIWIERLGRYLGVAHRHYFDNPKHMQHIDDRVQYAFGKVKTSDVPFSFGYSYRAIFFTLTEDLRLDRFSRELLFPALDSANAPRSATGAVPQFAEGIQFVTSAVVNPGEGVTVLYGINDCETAKMKLSFERLEHVLEFAHSPDSATTQRSLRRARADTLALHPRFRSRSAVLFSDEDEEDKDDSASEVRTPGELMSEAAKRWRRGKVLSGERMGAMGKRTGWKKAGLRQAQNQSRSQGQGKGQRKLGQGWGQLKVERPGQSQTQSPPAQGHDEGQLREAVQKQSSPEPPARLTDQDLSGDEESQEEKIEDVQSNTLDSCASRHLSLTPLPSPVRQGGHSGRLPALFVHMHKSGGTAMCHLAHDNGERLASDWVRQNCNHPDEDIAHLQLGDSTSCETRVQRSANQTYQSVERWLDHEFCPASLQYVTLLRDPLDRMVANFNFAKSKMWYASNLSSADVMQWTAPAAKEQQLMDASGQYVVRWASPAAVHPAKGQQLLDASAAAFDNFYIRVLGGPDVYHLPAGAIQRKHLELAQARLANFSVVMIHENRTKHMHQLTRRLGWAKLKLDCAQQEDNAHFPPELPWVREILCEQGASENPFTDEQQEKLRRQNALDYELYCYAAALAEMRTAGSSEAMSLS